MAVAVVGLAGCATEAPREVDATPAVAPSTGDEWIGGQVRQRLNSEGPDVAGVLIAVSDGMVTLRGSVANAMAAMRAEAAARSVAGVKSVRNELIVPQKTF